jgi:hypothetical protein
MTAYGIYFQASACPPRNADLLEKNEGARAMFRSSIRTKILAIAISLIILMVITAVLSLSLVTQVGRRLDQLTNSYIPAYGDLARAWREADMTKA